MYKQTGCRIKLQTLKGDSHGVLQLFQVQSGQVTFVIQIGTTVGTDVANVGYVVMMQTHTMDLI
jgi:hypothetical protein